MRQQKDIKPFMDRIKICFFYITLGLSSITSRGQQIGNYVSDGSFEVLNSNTNLFLKTKYWQPMDSANYSCGNVYLASTAPPVSNAPYIQGFQYPRSGNNFGGCTFYHPTSFNWMYPRNRLKGTLQANTTYCVKFYVNNANNSKVAIDSYGAHFADSSLDTLKCRGLPLTFLTPQIQNPSGNIISDTLNWTVVSGTFVANGNEKYLVIGNFKSASATNTAIVNPNGFVGNDSFIDDVSVIEVNLSAYAGPDKIIDPGDSVFIGRQPDFAIDPACIWYKLPNMTSSVDTISGLWVKPSVTSTYVVRQELDCSSAKWDTVVVTINTNLVALNKLISVSDNINLFPNPTSGNLNISFSSTVAADIKSYCITNTLGQMLCEEKIELKTSLYIVQTSYLVPGLYQIHFKTPFGTVTKKFIKTI